MAFVAAKPGAWKPEEDHLLASWQAKLGNKWAQIAQHIPGRTGQQCAQRWRHKVNPGIVHQPWTPAEDSLLASLVESTGQHWAAIARHLPGRTDQQCLGRWRRHLDPSIFRGGWTAAEDALVLQLHAQVGNAWSQIARRIPSRTSHQCRGRFFQLQNKAVVDVKKTKAAHRKATTKAGGEDSYEDDSSSSESEQQEDQDTGTVVRALPAPATRPAKAATGSAATAHAPSSAHPLSKAEAKRRQGLNSAVHAPQPADTLATQCAPSKGSHHLHADTHHQASSKKVAAPDRSLGPRSAARPLHSLAHLSGSERSERTRVPLTAIATPCNLLQPPMMSTHLPSATKPTDSLPPSTLKGSGAGAAGLLATVERRPSTHRKRAAVRRTRCTPLLFRTIGRRAATPPADAHDQLACIPLCLDEEGMQGAAPAHSQHNASCLTGRSKGSCADLADDMPTASVAGPGPWVPNPLPASSLIKRKSMERSFNLAADPSHGHAHHQHHDDDEDDGEDVQEEEQERVPYTPTRGCSSAVAHTGPHSTWLAHSTVAPLCLHDSRDEAGSRPLWEDPEHSGLAMTPGAVHTPDSIVRMLQSPVAMQDLRCGAPMHTAPGLFSPVGMPGSTCTERRSRHLTPDLLPAVCTPVDSPVARTPSPHDFQPDAALLGLAAAAPPAPGLTALEQLGSPQDTRLSNWSAVPALSWTSFQEARQELQRHLAAHPAGTWRSEEPTPVSNHTRSVLPSLGPAGGSGGGGGGGFLVPPLKLPSEYGDADGSCCASPPALHLLASPGELGSQGGRCGLQQGHAQAGVAHLGEGGVGPCGAGSTGSGCSPRDQQQQQEFMPPPQRKASSAHVTPQTTRAFSRVGLCGAGEDVLVQGLCYEASASRPASTQGCGKPGPSPSLPVPVPVVPHKQPQLSSSLPTNMPAADSQHFLRPTPPAGPSAAQASSSSAAAHAPTHVHVTLTCDTPVPRVQLGFTIPGVSARALFPAGGSDTGGSPAPHPHAPASTNFAAGPGARTSKLKAFSPSKKLRIGECHSPCVPTAGGGGGGPSGGELSSSKSVGCASAGSPSGPHLPPLANSPGPLAPHLRRWSSADAPQAGSGRDGAASGLSSPMDEVVHQEAGDASGGPGSVSAPTAAAGLPGAAAHPPRRRVAGYPGYGRAAHCQSLLAGFKGSSQARCLSPQNMSTRNSGAAATLHSPQPTAPPTCLRTLSCDAAHAAHSPVANTAGAAGGVGGPASHRHPAVLPLPTSLQLAMSGQDAPAAAAASSVAGGVASTPLQLPLEPGSSAGHPEVPPLTSQLHAAAAASKARQTNAGSKGFLAQRLQLFADHTQQQHQLQVGSTEVAAAGTAQQQPQHGTAEMVWAPGAGGGRLPVLPRSMPALPLRHNPHPDPILSLANSRPASSTLDRQSGLHTPLHLASTDDRASQCTLHYGSGAATPVEPDHTDAHDRAGAGVRHQQLHAHSPALTPTLAQAGAASGWTVLHQPELNARSSAPQGLSGRTQQGTHAATHDSSQSLQRRSLPCVTRADTSPAGDCPSLFTIDLAALPGPAMVPLGRCPDLGPVLQRQQQLHILRAPSWDMERQVSGCVLDDALPLHHLGLRDGDMLLQAVGPGAATDMELGSRDLTFGLLPCSTDPPSCGMEALQEMCSHEMHIQSVTSQDAYNLCEYQQDQPLQQLAVHLCSLPGDQPSSTSQVEDVSLQPAQQPTASASGAVFPPFNPGPEHQALQPQAANPPRTQQAYSDVPAPVPAPHAATPQQAAAQVGQSPSKSVKATRWKLLPLPFPTLSLRSKASPTISQAPPSSASPSSQS